MKILVAFPSTENFGQQVALALREADALDAMLVSFARRPDWPLARGLARLSGLKLIVMAEALASAPPVLGLCRGAVPEVVEDGVSGYVAGTVDELVVKVARSGAVDRADCRAWMEAHYSACAVVTRCLAVFRSLLASRSARAPR